MPIPQIPIYLDVAAGAVVALGGYTLQEWFVMRRRVRSGGPVERVERRRGDRATETAGVSLEQQAEDLAAAIDVMVAFVDGPARLTRARSCASQVGALVSPERRGPLTRAFMEMIEAGARPAEAQEFAESVCVQMAVELRAILARASRQPGAQQEHSEHAEAAIAEAELRHARPSLVADVATASTATSDEAVAGEEDAEPVPEPSVEPPPAEPPAAEPSPAAPATPRRVRKATTARDKPAPKRAAKAATAKPAAQRRATRKTAAAGDTAEPTPAPRPRARRVAKRGGPGAADAQAEPALEPPVGDGNYEDYT